MEKEKSKNMIKSITKNKVWSVITTIIKSVLVILIIGFIMFFGSAGGAEVYRKDVYNSVSTGSWNYHAYLNPIYGMVGIIIYILINCFGFFVYNYITNKFKNYKTTIGKCIFILFSVFINLLMLIIYFDLFDSYSFENGFFEIFNSIIICYGWITFPIIFFITYIDIELNKRINKINEE